VRRAAQIPLFAVLALLLALPAPAGPKDRPVELTGYITDHWCDKSKAEEPCVDCEITCSDEDADVVIYADGKLYRLDDREKAVKHIGHKVVVRGTVDGNDVVKVESIEKARKGA
jgi:hypothetical protein